MDSITDHLVDPLQFAYTASTSTTTTTYLLLCFCMLRVDSSPSRQIFPSPAWCRLSPHTSPICALARALQKRALFHMLISPEVPHAFPLYSQTQIERSPHAYRRRSAQTLAHPLSRRVKKHKSSHTQPESLSGEIIIKAMKGKG